MQSYKDQLIQRGIWLEADPRDPETDEDAIQELLEWIKKQFVAGTTIQIDHVLGVNGYRPLIHHRKRTSVAIEPLYTGLSLMELSSMGVAACASALALQSYFYRHPELKGSDAPQSVSGIVVEEI